MKLKKYLLAVLFLFTLNGAFAQEYIDPNQPMVDFKRLHFGFSVGMNTQNLMFTHTGVDQNGKKYFAEVSSYNPGFSVGLVSDLALTRYFNLRFVPSLHFGSKDIRFTTYDNVSKVWNSGYESQESEIKLSDVAYRTKIFLVAIKQFPSLSDCRSSSCLRLIS